MCVFWRPTESRPARPEAKLRTWREFLDWSRAAQVVALGVVDAEVTEAAQEILVLHALGNGAHAETGRDRHQRADDPRVRCRIGEAADELGVDLQEAERQMAQVGERAEARADVVEGEVCAQALDPRREVAQRLDRRRRDGLGDLEDQEVGIEVGRPHLRLDHVQRGGGR